MWKLNLIGATALSMLLLSGCAASGDTKLSDDSAPIEFAPQSLGFSENIPEGWSVDEGGMSATKGSCIVSPSVKTMLHTGMDLGDDAVTNAAFITHYAHQVIPTSSSRSTVTVENALGEKLDFAVYQFDRELVTISPDNNQEDNPLTIEQNVRSFVALRGLSEAFDLYNPSGENNEDRQITPVLAIDGYCEDPNDYEPDTMEAVAASAVFVEGPDPTEYEEEIEEDLEETP